MYVVLCTEQPLLLYSGLALAPPRATPQSSLTSSRMLLLVAKCHKKGIKERLGLPGQALCMLGVLTRTILTLAFTPFRQH